MKILESWLFKEVTMRKKPYTTDEFFEIIMERLKDQGLVPDILDYALPDREPVHMKTYEFGIENSLDFGGNEGIYLDLRVKFYGSNDFWTNETVRLGTIKTFCEDRESMRKMGELLADFMFEANRFANANLDDFTWTGWKVKPLLKDGSEAPYSVDCKSKEGVEKWINTHRSAEKYKGVEITNYATRETRTEMF